MTVRPSAPLDDLVRALSILQPVDGATCRRIAAFLGAQEEPLSAELGEEPGPIEPSGAEARIRPRRADREWPETSRRRRTRRASDLLREEPAQRAPPAWLASAPRLAQSSTSAQAGHALPFQPLLDDRWSRAIISGAIALLHAGGDIDLNAVVDLIARDRALDEVPQANIPTMARGINLLIDLAGGMEPFARDQADLARRMVGVAGRERTRLMYFAGCPQRCAGGRFRDDWTQYVPPVAGTPVIAISDLGAADPPPPVERAHEAEWIEFGARLRRSGCPLLAFVPYNPERVSPAVRAVVKVIPWDRRTGVTTIRRIVGHGLKVER